MMKQEEINLFKNIVAQLPLDAEYLRSILGGIEGSVEDAIRNDFGCIPFRELSDEQHKLTLENKELATKKLALEKEVRDLERKRGRLLDDLDEAKKLALRVYQTK